MSSPEIATRLATLRASTAALLTGLDAERWSDADIRSPSILTGWSRGHVLTHLARNADGTAATLAGALRGEDADGTAATLAGALRGEDVPRYPNGPVGRAADIEAGAGRAAADLLGDVRDAAERLDRVYGAVADADGWELTADGRPARAWINARWLEVEIHHVDLDGAYRPQDWPAAFVGYLLPRLAAEIGPRIEGAVRIEVTSEGSTSTDLGGAVWTAGDGPAVDVCGPDWALLAWLIGRPSLAASELGEAPELTPWL